MQEGSRDAIRRGIGRLRGRWWRVSLVRFTLRGLFYALIVAALVVLFVPELGFGTVTLAVLAASAATSLVASLVLRPTEVHLAKAFDDAAGLADRVSSTLELAEAKGPMVDALRAEAEEVAQSIPAAEVYPYQVPREGRWLPVPALIFVVALLVPVLTAPSAVANEAFEESLEERIEALEELLSIEREKALSPKALELLEELQKLQSELDKDQVDKKDTQAEVARMLDRLKKERDEEREKEQELRKLLKALQENTAKKDLDPSLQQGDYQKALNKLREELEELQKELEKKRKEGATPEELKELEELIKKLKEIEAKLMELMQLNLDLRFMGQAIDFLSHWDGELGDLEDFDPDMILEPGEP